MNDIKRSLLAIGCLCLFFADAYGHDDVDAGLYNSISERYYFFFDGEFVAKDFNEDVGNVFPISSFGGNYPSDWDDGIDAAVFNSNTQRYFFFKYVDASNEWRYISKDYGSGENFSNPSSMDQFADNNFPFECAVDAAVYDPLGEIYYFFKDDGSYCVKEQGADKNFVVRNNLFTSNYPDDFILKAIALRTGQQNSDDTYFFFSNDDYVRKIYGETGFTETLSTREYWPGWPAKHGTPPPVQPLDINLPEALFTDPETVINGDTFPVIKNRLIDLINASKNELVLEVYSLDDPDIAEALFNAHQRGVHVTLLTDDYEENDFANLDRNRYIRGMVDYLQFIETDGIIHNKVGLFPTVQTSSGDLNHVVFSSSSNFTSGAYRKFQDVLTISDEAIFNAFVEQKEKIMTDDKSYIWSTGGARDGMRAYFFPRNSDVDTVDDILKNLRNDKTYGDLESITVKINMGSWTTTRGDVLDQLREISNLPGGNVQIIASGWKTAVESEGIEQGIGNGNVSYNFLTGGANTHSKYMLVELSYKNSEAEVTTSNIVYAGSQNFTWNALRRHFESWIKIINEDIYASYLNNFNEIWYLTTGTTTSTVQEPELPEDYDLSLIYPNPFNSRAVFTLSLGQSQHVRITAYNMLGQEVTKLHDGELKASEHTFTFQADNLSSGMYLMRVEGEHFLETRPAILLK